LSAALRRSFDSLSIPNYRRYFSGQLISISGNWMQVVAEMWLILELTNSGVAVGITSALQFVGMLGFGAWGGVLADRVNKRSLLFVTQALMMLPALALFGVTVSGAVTPAMVFALVFARGVINAIDNPTRQAFVMEMVGADRVVNAVSLNSVIIHSSRIIGPAVAGLVIATLGVEPCFLINAASFGAMIIALRSMNPAQLRPAAPAAREPGAIRAGIRYVASTPRLAIPLAMMALVGTLGFNFQVILPLFARFTFDGGATAYTLLAVAMAAGSVVGALAAGARGHVDPKLLVTAALGFGGLAAVAASAPTLPFAALALVPLGAASVTFAAGVNSWLQLNADPEMRGRVMALYSIVFLGSTPIGGPIAGFLSEAIDPRAALLMTATAATVAGLGARIAFERLAPSADASDGRRWWWRVSWRRPVAAETRGADELDGLEGRRGLDVEPNAVALLDRRDGGFAPAPGERNENGVAGTDGRDLRPDPGQTGGDHGEGADRPQPHERDSSRALGREAGRGPCRGQRPTHRLGRPRRAPKEEADRNGDDPPRGGDNEGRVVRVLVRDHDRDGAERGGDARDQEDGDPQQVTEEHRSTLTRAP
jgi:MFS family permease